MTAFIGRREFITLLGGAAASAVRSGASAALFGAVRMSIPPCTPSPA